MNSNLATNCNCCIAISATNVNVHPGDRAPSDLGPDPEINHVACYCALTHGGIHIVKKCPARPTVVRRVGRQIRIGIGRRRGAAVPGMISI